MPQIVPYNFGKSGVSVVDALPYLPDLTQEREKRKSAERAWVKRHSFPMDRCIHVLWAHNAEALSSCIRGDDVDSRALLDEAVVELNLPVGKSTHHEFTVAHAAMLCNNGGVINKLLHSDTQLATVQTREGLSLLHCAVAGCCDERMDVIDSLIAAGCSPTQRLHDGTTLAMLAAWSGNLALLRRFYSSGIAYDNSTVLMAAAYGGHLDAIEYVLSRGECVHAISHWGLTALDHAALGGSVEAMQVVMQRGARAGWTEDGTDNLLVLTSTSGHVDAIAFALDDEKCDEVQADRALEAAYWSVDALAFLLSHRRCSSRAIERAMFAAAHNGRVDSLRFLVTQQGANLSARDPCGGGLLHSALRSGNEETIQFVLDCGAIDVRREDESCETSLLMAAASSGNVAAMRLIYGRGAKKMNERGSKMNFGAHTKSTLVVAALAGSAEAMKFCISHGSRIDETNEYGQCVLSAAAESGSPGAIQCAYDFGATYHSPSYCNPPPMFAVAVRNNVALMQRLLDERHCTLDEWDKANFSCSLMAEKCAKARAVDALQFALERSKMPQTEEQQTTTYYATLVGGSLDAMRLVECAFPQAQLQIGMSVLMVAARLFSSSVFQYALQRGDTVDSTDNFGMTPLLHAAAAGCVPYMRELVARGAKWSARDSSNRSLILHAASVPAVRFALECGCSITETDDDGRSIMHHAASEGRIDVMRLAMELGCSVDAEDSDKSTPLPLAGGWEVISFALESGACLLHRNSAGRTVFTNTIAPSNRNSVQYALARGAPVTVAHYFPSIWSS